MACGIRDVIRSWNYDDASKQIVSDGFNATGYQYGSYNVGDSEEVTPKNENDIFGIFEIVPVSIIFNGKG